MSAIVTTEQKRMGHMPHPPLWNAVEIAVSMNGPPALPGFGGGGSAVQGGIHEATSRDDSRHRCRCKFSGRSISGRVDAFCHGEMHGNLAVMGMSDQVWICGATWG